MDENTNTTKTEPVVDAGLKQRTLTTAQAIIELLIALATKWGWADWLIKLLAVLGIIIAALLGTSCGSVKVTPEQLQKVHTVYHKVSGKECLFGKGK